MSRFVDAAAHMRVLLIVLSLFIAHKEGIGSEAKSNKQMQATAFEKDTKKVLYTEKHSLIYDDNKLLSSHTRYFDPNGKLIAEMKSDYRRSLMMPTYVFEDHRLGSKEGLELRDGKYYIFNENSDKKREEKVIKDPKGIFSCQGWHYYIVENIEQIESKDLSLNLLFPSKLDYYSFDLQKQASEGSTLELSLEFSNWFIRLFAPRLDITYDPVQKKLLSYLGPSNILDTEGDIQYVKVVYD
ncbi:MAG: hypothetical protein HRU09_14555 [Oligoflexales bacterium]|nr:hypothetical protein [Oligoflexales bacterium]